MLLQNLNLHPVDRKERWRLNVSKLAEGNFHVWRKLPLTPPWLVRGAAARLPDEVEEPETMGEIEEPVEGYDENPAEGTDVDVEEGADAS